MRLNFYVVILKFLFISCIRISSNDFFTSAYKEREIFNLQDSIFETIQTKFIIPSETNNLYLFVSKVNFDGFERKFWNGNGSYLGKDNNGDRVSIYAHNNFEE